MKESGVKEDKKKEKKETRKKGGNDSFSINLDNKEPYLYRRTYCFSEILFQWFSCLTKFWSKLPDRITYNLKSTNTDRWFVYYHFFNFE